MIPGEKMTKLKTDTMFKQFLKYCIPTVLSLLVFSLYTMVDGMFVAWGVSELALSAVNICMPFVQMLFAVAILFAVGTSTVSAVLSGQQRHAEANRVFSQNAALLAVAGAVMTVVVLVFTDQIAEFLGAVPENGAYVRQYLRGLAPFCISIMISYSLEILVKTDGFPHLAIVAVVTGAVTNCVLDYLFVMVFGWGVPGAAVATGMAQTLVMLIYIIHFLKKRGKFRFVRFRFDPKVYKRIIPIGIPDGLTELSVGVTVFMFNWVVLRFIGVGAVVSYTITSYIGNIVIMVMAGISQGIQPLVSYYKGCGELDCARKLFGYAVKSVAVMSVISLVICVAAAPQIAGIYISGGEAGLLEYSVHVLRVYSISFLIAGYNIVTSGFLVALEKPVGAIAISLLRSIVVLACSLFVLTAVFGGEGIWWATTLTEGICLVISLLVLRSVEKGFRHGSAHTDTLATMRESGENETLSC